MAVDVDLEHLGKVLFLRFLLCKATLFLLSVLSFLEGDTVHSPNSEGRVSSLGAEYLQKISGILGGEGDVFSSHVFSP